MNIQVRVLSAQATKQIRDLEAELAAVNRQISKNSSAMNTMGQRGIPGLSKWGNQVQWAGRQLQYNFTLPILLAGGAATKFALDNEKAMTRVIKVYGDGSAAFNKISQTEIPALEKAFEALSNKFGVAQADAINIAADWAAAGASGLALAKSVDLTMQTMVLGEMDAAEATQALIAIQAQYGYGIKDLTKVIDTLNMVENQTGISMQGLVQGFARAAGVARSAGVDVQHLAAFMAALTPAAGSAAQAGNGLKTIFSRILAPTKEGAELLGKMGINVQDLAWQSQNGSQRLETLAKKFDGLSDAQKAGVSATLASRYQINRFDVLMRDIINTNGYYQKSLNSTADAQTNFNQKQRELNAVLNSNPQRLKQIWTILQNAMADVIQPMIPVILLLASETAKLVTWFSQLDPAIQKMALGFLLLLAAVGPVTRYIGSVSVLLGLMTQVVHVAGLRLLGLGKAAGTLITGPFSMVGTVIGGAFSAIGRGASTMGGVVLRAMTYVRTVFAIGMAGVTASARIIAVRMVAQMRGLLLAGFSLMGRNLLIIWSATWTQMMALAVGGSTRIVAVFTVLRANLVRTMMMMSVGIAAMARGMWIAIVAGLGRSLALVPVMFARLGPILLTFVARIGATLSALGPVVMAALTNPWTYAVLAALGILYAFKDDLAKLWNAVQSDAVGWLSPVVRIWDSAVGVIEKAFWRLPSSVRDAIMTVVNIIASAAKQVYEWFSYLNPFAHHSPSLVEQVTAGMAVVKKQYASVGDVGSIFGKAARDLALYKNAISGLKGGPFSDERSSVAKGLPSALPLFDALIGDLKALNAVLAAQGARVAAQQAVVDKWKTSLDAANAALDREQAKLQTLQDKLGALNDEYSKHQQAMQNYAQAPIKGMGAMEDQIFANEQAQKKLRLEMLKWEQANGSIEDVKNNMAKLAGSIEALKGEQASLRAAGAGSDILGPMGDQIASMQKAYDQMGNTVNNSPIADLQKQLDELQKKAEMLDLEKSIKFDPMIREIDKLANAQKELSYKEIVDGINREKAAMAALEPQIASATAAVNKQQAAVDAATKARDAIQARYDMESKKLDVLKDQYSKTEDAIRAIENALQDMGSTASAAIDKASAKAKKLKADMQGTAAANFDAAAGANFPDVGGTAKIGREGGLGSQAKDIEAFTKGITDDISKTFGDFDMMKPIKDMWNKGWAWMEKNVFPRAKTILNNIKGAFAGSGDAFKNNGLVKGMGHVWDTIVDMGTTAWGWITNVIDLFKDDFQKIVQEIVKAGRKIWDEIGPELAKFGDLLPGIGKLFGVLWSVVKVVAAVFGSVLLLALKVVTSILAHTLGPILDTIIGIIKNVIKIVRGLAEVIVGVFTGDWSMAWQGMKDIVSGTFQGIWEIIKGAGKIIWGVVRGLVEGVVDFFKWLWDVLVGHSIIPDTVNAIVKWFASLPGKVWAAVKSLVDKLVQVAKDAWNGFMTNAKAKWAVISAWIGTLPQATYDKIKAIKDKLGSIATTAWDWLRAKASASWNITATWISGIPQSAYDRVKSIKDKLGTASQAAFDWFRSKASTSWATTRTWISGIPQSAYDHIKGIKDKLASAASAAFGALFDKGKAIVDGKNGMMSWISKLPGRIASAMGGVGSAVANAVKSSWNAAAGWINKNGIANVNKVTEKLGLHIPSLPGFAGGGVIPGKISKKDNTIIAARTGEGVIVPELVKAMGGKRGLDRANYAARTGRLNSIREMGLPGFKDGGLIGSIASSVGGWMQKGAGYALDKILAPIPGGIRDIIPGRPVMEDVLAGSFDLLRGKAKAWGDKKEEGGNGVLGGTGWKWQVDVLKKQFPGIIITSTSRPGAITASGNTSYHSMGRAVDMAPDMKYFDWIRATYGKNTKELIYSPAGNRQIKNGAPFTYTGAVKDMHYNHVHWAYDKGGIMPPGLTMAYNGTGKDEVTVTHDVWNSLSNVVSMMDRATQKSMTGTTPGSAMVSRTGATIASLEAKLRQQDLRTQQEFRSQGSGGDTHLHFNGDLVLPNITNGEDAEDFVKHLKGLAG